MLIGHGRFFLWSFPGKSLPLSPKDEGARIQRSSNRASKNQPPPGATLLAIPLPKDDLIGCRYYVSGFFFPLSRTLSKKGPVHAHLALFRLEAEDFAVLSHFTLVGELGPLRWPPKKRRRL